MCVIIRRVERKTIKIKISSEGVERYTQSAEKREKRLPSKTQKLSKRKI